MSKKLLDKIYSKLFNRKSVTTLSKSFTDVKAGSRRLRNKRTISFQQCQTEEKLVDLKILNEILPQLSQLKSCEIKIVTQTFYLKIDNNDKKHSKIRLE